MIEPIDHAIWRVAVQAPRRGRGTISLAYAGAFAMKNPQGTPSKACPTTSSVSELAYAILVRYQKQKAVNATHKERYKNRGVHKNQPQNSSPTVSETVCNRTSEENTDEGTALAGLEKSTLPFCWNCPTGTFNENTEFFLKGTLCDKVTVQEHIERFHNLTGISCYITQIMAR